MLTLGSLYYSGRLFQVNVMNFAHFLESFEVFSISDGEPMAIAALVLALFMLAVYLLSKRESQWHTISGAVTVLVAVFYALAAADLLYVDSSLAVDILGRALHLFGLA